MAEIGFQEQRSVRSSYIGRDASTDSLIFTLESNFSHFSSASASVERCSFASDAHDQDSLASQLSLHLAGHERDQNEGCSGPDPDANKAITVRYHNRLSRKREKVKVQKEENDATHEKDENQLIDSARNSFSLALKDCEDRRTRSEALLNLPEKLGSTSLDLNNVSASPPRLGTMKKSSVATRKSGAFPSHVTSNYHHHSSAGMQKGWNSERVSLHNNGIKRQGSAAGVLCCNNGKTLPSKWEDAERWILSPGSGDDGVRQSIVPRQRRPKSKSGPLGPPGTAAYNSLCSPSMYIFDGSNTGNFLVGSPFSAGVISTNGLTIHSGSHYGGFTVRAEPCMARSVSVHGCSEVVRPPLLPSRDENLYTGLKDATTDTSPTVSRRDMATQMSPQDSTRSSPKGSTSFCLSSPSALPIKELQGTHSSKSEVRDVQIDERVTLTRWSKKHVAANAGKSSEIVDDWSKRVADTQTPTWDVTETAKCISKIKREEAKITAWENLQKAKAEAAIRKLEMKLEKKRSSSMDKIMNKLRSAQKRAQQMRSSVLSNQALEVTRSSHETTSFCRTRQMGSLSGCFTCHAF